MRSDGTACIARDELSRSALCEDSLLAHTDVLVNVDSKALHDIYH